MMMRYHFRGASCVSIHHVRVIPNVHRERRSRDEMCTTLHVGNRRVFHTLQDFNSKGITPPPLSRGRKNKFGGVKCTSQEADLLDRRFSANSQTLGIVYVRVIIIFQKQGRRSRMALLRPSRRRTRRAERWARSKRPQKFNCQKTNVQNERRSVSGRN
jgi:hypothetical protein